MKSVYDRLTIQDQNNLWVETPEAPMHVMAVLQVESEPFLDEGGQLRLGAIRRQVDRRLARVPRLRQVVMPGSLLTGPPIWVDEPGFDVRRHVRAASVPAPGREKELLEAVATIDEQRLDRSHALWELWLLTGLANGRIAIVFKLHHAIADGLAAIALVASLFHFTAAGNVDHPPSAVDWRPQLPPRRADLIRDNLAGKLAGGRRLLAGAIRPAGVWRAIVGTPRSLCFIARQAGRAPRTSLNRPLGPRRRLGVFRLPLADAKAVAHAHGGKVNDVFLTIVAAGLRALLVQRREPVEGLEMMANVPVSMRHDIRLGNEVGGIIVALPIGGSDAAGRLGAVIRGTQGAKREQSAAHGMMFFTAIARSGLSRWLGRHQRFVNLFATNVAGPPVPIDVLGARVLDIIPVTPIGGNCTLGFAAFSYNGSLAIAAVADAEQVSDLDVALKGMERDWSALSQSVAVAAAR